MNNELKELWQRFENEFLQSLAHHYNDEDEAEFIKPLRDAIMGVMVLDLYGFSVYVDEDTYQVFWGSYYVGKALSKYGIVNLVSAYIHEHNQGWNGPTSSQFESKFWQVAGALK